MTHEFPPQEWALRTQLAACYRLLAKFGFSDLAGGHVSARIPGTDHYLLNPYGFLFEDVTASSIIRVDLDGNFVGGGDRSLLNKAALAVHSIIYRNRPDVLSIGHCHPWAVTAVSALESGLLPVDQAAIGFWNELAYSDYNFLETDEELSRMIAELGGRNVLILRNHGLLALGGAIPDVWYRTYKLSMACEVQLRAQSAAGGRPLRLPSDEVCSDAASRWETPLYAAKAWEALLRRLDAEDQTYKL